MTDYVTFLASKRADVALSGFTVAPDAINPKLFLFQRDIVRWALRLGKAAIFAECGMGKTAMQLEWAHHVALHTGGKVLILAPLAVAEQTVREGQKFDIPVEHVYSKDDLNGAQIVITNYERLHLMDASVFTGVVLDESSILKAFTGKTKRQILELFKATPYKLACTATPAPNDHLELGNHADFLNIMASNEMISRWFINDTMAAGDYRLKGHAEKDFWRWLTTWAVCISKPGDLGEMYDMPGFDLPELRIHEHQLAANAASIQRAQAEGLLFPDTNPSSTTLHKVKRESLNDRVDKVVELVESIPPDDNIIIWCDTNYEADALRAALPLAVEVRGSDSTSSKEEKLRAFGRGDARIIITKPDIAGFGLNWQHCHQVIYAGVGFSFEKLYQSLKRTHRYGQTQPVETHLIYAETEGNVRSALTEKQAGFEQMQRSMNEAMHEYGLFRDGKRLELTLPGHASTTGDGWTMYLGDCVTTVATFEENSVDFSVYSPPFANLYIYSDSEADMGNSSDSDEFFAHYEYLIRELYRVTLPGRLTAVHCKDLPAYMNRDGSAGLRDFPGDIVRAHERYGWQYHSRVTIWKDPVIEMQRTKNHGLLHKNFADRSEACRQGMPDYLLVFRKWPIEGGREIKQQRVVGDYVGTNPPTEAEISPRGRTREQNYSIAVWQRYASPVWYDIDQTNVLNYLIAKTDQDSKHICPLQLDVIARAIDLWSAPGDVVLSPFAGIGSEGYEAIKRGRKFVGVELKQEYYDIACANLTEAERQINQIDLFTHAGVEVEGNAS